MNLGKYKLVEYLGDAVYIGLDDIDRLWIFTHNGVSATNEICLESEVVDNFIIAMGKFGYK